MLELRVPPRLFPSRLPTLRLWSPWLLPSGVRTLRLCACEFWWRFRSRHGRGLPRRRRAPLDVPMSDIPRVVFPDYKRKLRVAMTQKGKGRIFRPRIICGCRRWTSAKAGQSEVSEPNPYRARNRKFESIPLQPSSREMQTFGPSRDDAGSGDRLRSQPPGARAITQVEPSRVPDDCRLKAVATVRDFSHRRSLPVASLPSHRLF